MNSRKGIAWVVILAVIAILGGGVVILKPKVFNGESRRAAQSSATTTKLETAYDKNGAVVAASINQINQVASLLPDSREKTFLGQESSFAATLLPTPDPMALIAAERRKNAILEGQVELTKQLYDSALKNSDKLNKELEAAKQKKAQSDLKLEEVAASHLAVERQRNIALIVAGSAIFLYWYVKKTHIGIGAISELATDLKKGVDPIVALDGVTSRFQQKLSSFISKVKS